MHDTILNMTWNDFMESDYSFKSNTEKRVIEVKGSDFDPSDNSLFVLYFNVFTGELMIALQHTDKKPIISDKVKEKFIITDTEDVETDEDKYFEVVFVQKALSKALEDQYYVWAGNFLTSPPYYCSCRRHRRLT